MPVVDAVATHDAETGEVTVFVVNRDVAEAVDLTVPLAGFRPGLRVAESWTLADDDLSATNTADHPDRVVPRQSEGVAVADGALRATLPLCPGRRSGWPRPDGRFRTGHAVVGSSSPVRF